MSMTAPVAQPMAAPQPAATGGKKKGKPDHAGGPNKAKALPPGLQGKDLPEGNPWKAVADRLKKEAEQQKGPQPQAAGAQVTALDQMSYTA